MAAENNAKKKAPFGILRRKTYSLAFYWAVEVNLKQNKLRELFHFLVSFFPLMPLHIAVLSGTASSKPQHMEYTKMLKLKIIFVCFYSGFFSIIVNYLIVYM